MGIQQVMYSDKQSWTFKNVIKDCESDSEIRGAGNPESVLTYDFCAISDHFKYNDNDCNLNILLGRKKFVTTWELGSHLKVPGVLQVA